MSTGMGMNRWVKLAAFWVAFLLLNFGYRFLPFFPFNLFMGVSEAIFEHAKIAFYSYLLVSVIEYAIYAKKTFNRQSFIFSRLLVNVITPWFMMLIWYIAPAVYGKPMPSVPLEIIYANVAVFLLALCLVILERAAEAMHFTNASKIVILALVVILIMEFSIFTYQMPWTDVFEIPNF